jgi:hypothetical protein
MMMTANAWNDRLSDLISMPAWSWSVGFFSNTQWPLIDWVWQKVLSLRWRRFFSVFQCISFSVNLLRHTKFVKKSEAKVTFNSLIGIDSLNSVDTLVRRWTSSPNRRWSARHYLLA